MDGFSHHANKSPQTKAKWANLPYPSMLECNSHDSIKETLLLSDPNPSEIPSLNALKSLENSRVKSISARSVSESPKNEESEYLRLSQAPCNRTSEESLRPWSNLHSTHIKQSLLRKRSPISRLRDSSNQTPNLSSNIPKVSNIHQLLNNQEPNDGYYLDTASGVSSIQKVDSADRKNQLTSSNIQVTRASQMYNHFPYFHPYFGVVGDLSGSRSMSYTAESNRTYFYESNNITSIETPHFSAYGYHPVGPLDSKNHICGFPGCNMRFKRLEHLKRHFRVHTMEKPFKCTYEGCNKSFSRSDNLGQHLKTHERRAQKQHQSKIPSSLS